MIISTTASVIDCWLENKGGFFRAVTIVHTPTVAAFVRLLHVCGKVQRALQDLFC